MKVKICCLLRQSILLLVPHNYQMSDALLHPTVSSFPFLATAIVPVYGLDALGSFAALVFSRTALAKIFNGEITWWNDTEIQSTNTAVTMPALPITIMYENESSAINQVFLESLCKFYTPICTTVPSSSTPTWPLSSYAAYTSSTGASGVAGMVSTIDGALGYSTIAAALQTTASVGSMINLANSIVAPSATSVQYAVVGLGVLTLQAGSQTLDLTDSSGALAWPMSLHLIYYWI